MLGAPLLSPGIVPGLRHSSSFWNSQQLLFISFPSLKSLAGGKRNPRGSARCILDGGRGGIREEGTETGIELCCVLSLGVQGKEDGVWEGCPRGRGDVPLSGLLLFLMSFGKDFTRCVRPGIPEPQRCCSGLWQDGELAGLGGGCAGVPGVLQPRPEDALGRLRSSGIAEPGIPQDARR